MGEVYRTQGAYEKALEYFEEALDTQRRSFGSEHPNVANVFLSRSFP